MFFYSKIISTILASSPTSFIYENEDFMESYNRPSTIDNRTNKRPSSQKHNKKGVILPFNHPKYKRYLAEMPLFYLADDCDHRFKKIYRTWKLI